MKIALLQMTSGIAPEANVVTLVEAISAAAQGAAAMLFTPEMSGLIDRERERARRSITTEAEDAVLSAVRKAACVNGIWVHLGSLAVDPVRSDGRLANRGFVIDAAGEVRARYDKMHLFDVDLASGESWRESVAYAAGYEAVAVDTPVGRLGLSVCYDLRFPTLYQKLEAEVIAVPSAFTVPTGKAHWEVLLRARAIENAAFVVAAAQTGTHADGRRTYGHSMVVSPWGKVLTDMGEEPGIGFCNIDLVKVAEARARIPVIAHRRAIA